MANIVSHTKNYLFIVDNMLYSVCPRSQISAECGQVRNAPENSTAFITSTDETDETWTVLYV